MASFRLDKYRPSSGVLSHGADAQGEIRALYVEDNGALFVNGGGSAESDSQSSHDTQPSWQNVAVVQLSNPRTLKELKQYVLDESAGGNTTDARLLAADDPRHSASQGDPSNDDAPTGTVGNGDGWHIVDETLSANSNGIASGGDWTVTGSGYEEYTHLAVLQVQQGSGQETVYASLTVDEGK